MLNHSNTFRYIDPDDNDLEECDSPRQTKFREDLSHDEQLASINLYKWTTQAGYLEQKAREIEAPPHQKKVAIKILIDEAHILHQYVKSGRDAKAEHDEELKRRWSRVGTSAMRELAVSGPQHVIRNLSCMCIFVDGRQAEFYGEHEADRTRRVTQQCDVLNRLHVQRMQGRSACFLEDPGTMSA